MTLSGCVSRLLDTQKSANNKPQTYDLRLIGLF
jgi:hypothetical protein